VLILVAWGVGVGWCVVYRQAPNLVIWAQGVISYTRFPETVDMTIFFQEGWTVRASLWRVKKRAAAGQVASLLRYDLGLRLPWIRDVGRPGTRVTSYTLPLWIPLVVVAIPTVVFWYRGRRPPPGHCQTCGYNLTGNVSGRCPECGKPV